MKFTVVLLLSLAFWVEAGSPGYFFPSHRISGVGVERDALSAGALETRTGLMIQSQTFAIMREPQAMAGAKRISDPKLQAIFRAAAQGSGLPAALIEAIAYLESFGDPNAESPAGCKGIMQISEATAHDMGLRVVRATRYTVTREKVLVKSKRKKPQYKTVTHKQPYLAMVRDDRMAPDRAIPAAARYVATLERHFGGRDWAIFAYHCGIPPDEITVPRMFFSNSPTWNRELYLAIQQQMLRDYSPTYYFRILRTEELLGLYHRDANAFADLQQQYRNRFASSGRAPHRLSTWLTPDDLIYRTEQDIRANSGSRLLKAPDSAEYLGYSLQLSRDAPGDFSQAAPAALGTLTYIAFETRRLCEELNAAGETFQPLPVTALVESASYARQQPSQHEALAHSSGQVFDIDTAHLPAGEVECLHFVLDDLAWSGYLGFVEDGPDRLHIGCSPDAREFFLNTWQEAQEGLAAN